MTDEEVLNGMMSIGEEKPVQPTVAETAVEAEQTIQTNQVDADNYTLPMSMENFKKFLSALQIIQNICGDCDICSGNIRCRTDDHKNIVMMDLTSLLNERNLSFSGLKNKLAILGTFSLVQQTTGTVPTTNSVGDVLIEANQSNFEFSDSISHLIIRRPVRQYLTNVYIEDDEFSNINSCENRQDAVLFKTTVSIIERKRIAKICEVFGSNSVAFEFNGDICKYSTETSSKDNVSKTTASIPLNTHITGKKTLVNNLAFILDSTSDLEITCYLIGTEYLQFKFSTKYYGLPITIITKSRIVEA